MMQPTPSALVLQPGAFAALPTAVLAAPAAAPSTAQQSERSTEFVPVQGGHDTTSAQSLLVAAYIVMWALLLLFIFLSWRRQQALESRVVDLERAIGDADKASTESGS